MDKRVISINRSKELSEATKPYLEFKSSMSTIENQRRISFLDKKKKILSYYHATEENWNDWIWQIKHRIKDIDTLMLFINLSKTQIDVIKKVSSENRFAIVPYYLALLTDSENDPLFMQSIPSSFELITSNYTDDPMSEECTNPAGSITRRYPDRLIINVTNSCAMFCRHCQRRRLIKEEDSYIPLKEIEESIQYISNHPEIRDVLITGGDAFLLKDSQIDYLLTKLRNIPHIEIIRFGTRTLVTLPMRITDNLLQILRKHHPIYVNTHFNHPFEITTESIDASKKLAENAINIGNQAVLLKNINDDKYIMRYLGQKLLTSYIKPYYLFHAKKVSGTSHFVPTLKKGLEIMEHLRGNTSGMAIPTYILNAPNGLGKIPLLPQYIIEEKNGSYKIRTWENKVITYKDN